MPETQKRHTKWEEKKEFCECDVRRTDKQSPKKTIEKLANVSIGMSCRITVYIGTTVFAVSIERG